MEQKVVWKKLTNELVNQTFKSENGDYSHVDKSYNVEYPKDSDYLITLYSCTRTDGEHTSFIVVTDFYDTENPNALYAETNSFEDAFILIENMIAYRNKPDDTLNTEFKRGYWHDVLGKCHFPGCDALFDMSDRYIKIDTIYGNEHEDGYVETIITRIVTYNSIGWGNQETIRAWAVEVDFNCSENNTVVFSTNSHDVATILEKLNQLPIKGIGLQHSIQAFEKAFTVK